MKRGFDTKHDAEEWLRTFLSEQSADLNITFADFTEMYFKGIAPQLRENTLRTKHYIIDLKILPYFGAKKINEITPANIIAWENEMLSSGYSQTYMKTVYNHCALLYELGITPLEIVERLGHERVETTMQVYAHLYPNKQEKLSAMKKLVLAVSFFAAAFAVTVVFSCTIWLIQIFSSTALSS